MPRISHFYGISVYMYFRDHPPPHLHARYGEHEAVLEIASAEVLEGALPRRALSLVKDWIRDHQDELNENWRRARAGQALNQVDPLD